MRLLFSSSSFAPIAMAIIQRKAAIESAIWRWAAIRNP